MSRKATGRILDPLSRTTQQLNDAMLLSDVAMALREAAQSLSQTAKELTAMRATQWMTADQAAAYLGCESVKAFEKIVSREGIPKHYLSARVPRYNRAELDTWLMSRGEAVRR